MIKRLLATTVLVVGAGAMPVALGHNQVAADTLPLSAPAGAVIAPLQPVLGAVSRVLAPAPAQPAPAPESAPAPAAPSPASISPPAAAAPAAAPVRASTAASAPAAGDAHSANRSATPSSAPPPPGSASAEGAGLRLIDSCISCTGAGAGAGSSQAEAQDLRVLGLTLSGSDARCSSQSGALLSLPVGSLVDLGIADWTCSRQAASGSSWASSRSALVDLGVDGNQILSLSVLEGRSDASYDGDASQADGITNGVDLNLLRGTVAVTVLHTESSSDGMRRVDVARVNDLRVLGSDRADGGIPVDVPGVISVNLLRTAASGGIAGADVGSVSDVLSANGQAVGLLATTASGGPGSAGIPPVIANAVTGGTPSDPPPGIAHHTLAARHATGLGVPLTGFSLGIAGISLLISGLVALVLAARRRPEAAA